MWPAVRLFGLFWGAPVRGMLEARCIVLKRVLSYPPAISKAVYKFISASYVIILVRANAAKAKCKGV